MGKKVLLVHPKKASFIQADQEMLSKHFDLRVLDVGSYRKSLKNQLVVGYRLLRGVLWSDVSYSWFAERHASMAVRLSRMFGKPSVVIVGGYEVAKIPEIGYGSLLDPAKERRVRYILKNATAVIVVSKYLEDQVRSLSSPKRLETVYNAVDAERFVPRPPKEDLVVTVGEINKDTYRLKGIVTFIEAAASLPDLRFVVVGHSPDGTVDMLKSTSPGNVEFTGHVPNERLTEIYGKAKVYCQLSMHESFGVSLVESMSCGCVPVVASSGALPEVVGDTGFVVPYGDAVATSKAIKEALRKSDGGRARERVRKLFSAQAREEKMLAILNQIIS